MNKEDLLPFVKLMVEMNKKKVDEDTQYNLSKEQKEILKQFFDECYENFKRSK